MIKRGTFLVKPEDSSIIWNITVPEGSTKVRPLAAYDSTGDSHEIDSWSFEEGHLLVNFGIDPISGELEYEYQVETDDPVVIQGDGGIINIHVTQNNSPRT